MAEPTQGGEVGSGCGGSYLAHGSTPGGLAPSPPFSAAPPKTPVVWSTASRTRAERLPQRQQEMFRGLEESQYGAGVIALW